MDKLLKVASLLDNLGSYVLSDKLYKIAELYIPPVEFYEGVDKRHYNDYRAPGSKSYDEMMISRMKNMPKNLSGTAVMDGSMYRDNPYTPKEILDIRKKLIPTNFRNEISRYESGDSVSNSSNPRSFVTSLFEFGRKNGMNNLTAAFDAYADAGASYQGNLIKNVPVLQKLYMRVRNTPRIIPQQELAKELTMLTTPQKTNSNLQGKESQDLGTYWYEAVMREPLDGLETFKNEVLKNQELNESQKNNLIKKIDQRIMNKR
jgi:hypothetical protein